MGKDALLTHDAKLVPLSELKPYRDNPRRGDVEAIRESLRVNGQYRPLVVREQTREVLAGNHTLQAAKAEGWTEVWATFVRCDAKQARRIVLVDNRSSDVAGYDTDALAQLLGKLPTLEGTGYDDGALGELLAEVNGQRDPPPDAAPAKPKKPATHLGDLYVLGDHRVLCGDATNAEDAERLLGGDVADAMWTDPPYGVDYVGGTVDALTMDNDGAAGLQALLRGAFTAAGSVLAEGAAIYVAHPAGRLSLVFGEAFMEQGWRLHQTLVWIKDSMVLGRSDYHFKHEPLLFGQTEGEPVEPDPEDLGEHTPVLYGYAAGGGRRGRGSDGWWGDNRQTTVLEVPRPKRSRDHPTMKPVELVSIALRNSTRGGHTVLDPFAGSGSTLLACEHLGRRARCMEIDPAYCDVIVKRWENYTGQKAEKV